MLRPNRAPISEQSKRIRDQYASFQAARQNRPNLMSPPQNFQDRITQFRDNNPNIASRIDQFRQNAPAMMQRIGQGVRTYAQNNPEVVDRFKQNAPQMMDRFKKFSQGGGYDQLAKGYQNRMDSGRTPQNDGYRGQPLQRSSGNLMAHLQGRRNRRSFNS